MSIAKKLSLSLVCLLPTIAMADTLSLLTSNDVSAPQVIIHTTKLHTLRTLPFVVNIGVSVGTFVGTTCSAHVLAISNSYKISVADTNLTLDGQTLYNIVHAGYTCAKEVYSIPGVPGDYSVTYSILGNPVTYYQAIPDVQFVTM